MNCSTAGGSRVRHPLLTTACSSGGGRTPHASSISPVATSVMNVAHRRVPSDSVMVASAWSAVSGAFPAKGGVSVSVCPAGPFLHPEEWKRHVPAGPEYRKTCP